MATLFMRDKHMSAWDLDADHIVLQASLNDTDQILQMRCVVTYPDLAITEASMTFLRSPGRECLQAVPNVDSLVGLQIEPGYNKKVKEVLGGLAGCVHMVDLAIEIGHVGIQAKYKRMNQEEAGLSPEEKRRFWSEELKGQCVKYQ